MSPLIGYSSGAAGLGLHMTMPHIQEILNGTKRRCTTLSRAWTDWKAAQRTAVPPAALSLVKAAALDAFRGVPCRWNWRMWREDFDQSMWRKNSQWCVAGCTAHALLGQLWTGTSVCTQDDAEHTGLVGLVGPVLDLRPYTPALPAAQASACSLLWE